MGLIRADRRTDEQNYASCIHAVQSRAQITQEIHLPSVIFVNENENKNGENEKITNSLTKTKTKMKKK